MKGTKCADRKLGSILSAVLILGFCCIFSIPAHAQVTGATLTGTITDPSGGVVANASITAANTATGISRDVKSDASGLYTIANLVPGPYDVKVTATGFSTSEQSLALAVGQQQQLNFSLKVGQTSTTVQVTEAAPQIDLTSSAVSGQVESETVRELPLNGRDWTQLATLQPGVKPIENQMGFATSARGNRGFGGELTVSGQRSTFNNYRIDGITVNDYAMAAPGNVIGVVLGVDSIEEFQVLTGGFPAEYGRATGGVVNAISRSGTNQFHGNLYEFLRNSKLDSNDYFDRAAGAKKPQFKRNQFGATAGGPILKDKLFIFGDYEGMRQVKGVPSVSSVFSDNARNGIIAGQSVPAANTGGPWPLACTDNGGSAGTYITPSSTICMNNYSQKLLALYPHANTAVSGDIGNFVFAGAQHFPDNFGTTRVDYKIGNNDTLFGTFLRDETNFNQPDALDTVLTVYSTSRTTIALEESHTFGSSFVNAVRVGFNRDNVLNQFTPTAINPAAGDTTLGAVAGQNAPRITANGGISDFSGGAESNSHYLHVWNSYQYYDDAIWTHGNHTVKFGGGAERMLYNEHTYQEPGGRYQFHDYIHFLEGDPTGKSFEASLVNLVDEPREFRQTTFGAYLQDDWKVKPNLTVNVGMRWEPTTVLSDAQGRITDLAKITDTSPTCGTAFVAPIAAQPGYACTSVGGYYVNPTLQNFEPRIGFAWDPFKNGKTSVRGSFGIYDVDPFAGYFLLQQNQAAPFLIFKSTKTFAQPTGFTGIFNPQEGGAELQSSTGSQLAMSTVEGSPHRSYVQEWALSIQRQLASDTTLTVGYVGTHGVHLITRGDDGNMAGAPGSSAQYVTTPYGYLFPCGPVSALANCKPGQDPNGNNAQVNPALGTIRYIYWNASSNYNGLNVNLDKRFSHGFQGQIAYTFSKSLDNTSQTIAGDTFANGINSPWWFLPQAFYGPSDFNVQHTLTINALYTLPTPKSWSGALKEALAGWELGGIFSYNSGTPTTPIIYDDPLGLGNGGADQFGPLVQIPGCDPIDHGFANSLAGAPRWINQNCYTVPFLPTSFIPNLPYPCASGTNGFTAAGQANAIPAAPAGMTYCSNLAPFNVLRNSITGPHLANLDFSVHKVFPITRISETFNVQFRAEFFDITNHDNFVPPQPGSGDTLSGIFTITGKYVSNGGTMHELSNPQQPAREIQVALKVNW